MWAGVGDRADVLRGMDCLCTESSVNEEPGGEDTFRWSGWSPGHGGKLLSMSGVAKH